MFLSETQIESHITKTDFVRYLDCPLYAWLWKNRPDLREGHKNSRIADQGEEVEKIAYKLFEGQDVKFQAEAKTDHYLARADILKKDKDGERWHIFEVKSSTKKKPEHIADLSFQLNAFTVAGYEIASVNLILVNSDYVYREDLGLEVEKFFKIEDLTEEIFMKAGDFEPKMEEAYKVLTGEKEPKVSALMKSFKYELPEKFEEYYRRGVPEYSIYDVSNIRKNNLVRLAEMGVSTIDKIPDGFFTSDKMNLQVKLTKQKDVYFDKEGIKKKLATLKYPLYFLDYETINPAIPLFDRTRPYQKIPFQYSLHILESPDGTFKHKEFLHTEKTNPVPHLLKNLEKDIGESGSILVWNELFEKKCNVLMAESCPEYKEFLDSVNERIYDLMKIFQEKYLDYRFKGSASIKSVLPVIIPEMSYKDLEVKHGGMAMDAVIDIIEDKADDKKKLADELKSYCERDTLAMVKIFEFLKKL